MAYLNEFPHFEANKLNLDWILEQYSTFNQRLQELHDHFDEAVASMEQELASYKLEYEQAFADYKIEVNGSISDFEREVRESVASISNAIEQVSENVSEYVSEHMNEWQLEAMTDENNNVIIGDYDPQEPITEGGQIDEIIINNVAYKTSSIKAMRTIVFHTTLSQLNSVTAGVTSQTYTSSDTTGIYKLFNDFFTKYETDEVYCPITVTADLGSDNIDYAALNEMFTNQFLIYGSLRALKIGSDIYLNINWARKTDVTFTATNGFYHNVTFFLPN